jgi:hypothetical protein
MSRYEILLEKFQDGEESPAEAEELCRLVRDDPERGASLYDALMLEADLYESYAGIAQIQAAPRVRRKRLSPAALAAWAAAILMLLVLAVVLRTGGTPAGKGREAVPIAPRPPEPQVPQPAPPKTPPPAPEKTPRYRYPSLERGEDDDHEHGSKKDEIEREYQKGLREVERKRREGNVEEADKKLREIERERQKHLRESERRGGDR